MKPGDLVRIKIDCEGKLMVDKDRVCLLIKMPSPYSKFGVAGVVPVGAQNINPLPVYMKYLEKIG